MNMNNWTGGDLTSLKPSIYKKQTPPFILRQFLFSLFASQMFRCEQLFISMLESSFKVCLPLKVRWRGDVNKTNFGATPFCIFKPGFCIFKLELDRRLVCCPISTTLHSLTICFPQNSISESDFKFFESDFKLVIDKIAFMIKIGSVQFVHI